MLRGWISGHGGGPERAMAGALAATVLALSWVMLPAWTAGAASAAHTVTSARYAARANLPAGSIATVAGGLGGPGPATAVWFRAPFWCSSVQYAAGHLYIGDQTGTIRTVNVRTDWLRTPAGVGQGGFSGDGGPATKAMLNDPCAATADSAGNLVIADTDNGRVRVVAVKSGTFYGQQMTAGHIYTLLSGGHPCVVSNTSGKFCPVDVAVDHSGNLVVSNEGSEAPRGPGPVQIVVIAARSGTFYGHAMKAGGSLVLPGGGGAQVAVDKAGNLVFAGIGFHQVGVIAERTGAFYGRKMTRGKTYVIAGTGARGFSGDGGPARKAKLDSPAGVALDRAGNVVIADSENSRIRVVAVRSGTFYGRQMKVGDIYTIAGRRFGLSGNGIPAVKAKVTHPSSVTIDGFGNLVEFDSGYRARVIAATAGRFYGRTMKAGDIYTVAGAGADEFSGGSGPATRARLSVTGGVAVDHAGNLVGISSDRVWVVAANSATFYGRKMVTGNIYSVAGGGTGGLGDGGPATKAALSEPVGVTVDRVGNLAVSDTDQQRVRMVAVKTGTFYGKKMTAGDIYTVAGDGTGGFAGDGGLAANAELSGDTGLAVDGAGNLVIADTGNNRVRVVARTTGTFYGQAMTAGHIYTVAGDGTSGFAGDGGPAATAELNGATGLAVDGAGNLVIGDTGNSRVRVVAVSTGTFYGRSMTADDIYTVAGDGTAGFSGDGGPATVAELGAPSGIAVDAAGNLVMGDSNNNRLRVVAVSTGTFYGRSMTAGDIYTVAGDGTAGFSGDGGPAVNAELNGSAWVAADVSGNLAVSDRFNSRLRLVRG